MIFVSLGTHEQLFDRLIGEVNRLIENKIIREEVFMQTGYRSNIDPVCEHERFLSLEEMNTFMKKARVVIVHGGLGSIIQSFINSKVPIVVPRLARFGEHIDNHQILFSERLASEKKIIMVLDINELGNKILNYDKELLRLGCSGDPRKDIEKRSRSFALKLEKISKELLNINGNDI